MSDLYGKPVKSTLETLETDAFKGLTSEEVRLRILKYGENKLESKKEKGILLLFAGQFKDFLVIILIIAAIISVALGETFDGLIIGLVVVINAVLGTVQENKAGNALKALRELASPSSKVVRDGMTVSVPSGEIVPGDIIILDAGDYVPADLRLIETVNLKINESALTGESVPAEKDAEKVLPPDAGLGDMVNSAFMGTVVTYGRGRGVAANTGMKTEMGKIAEMITGTDEQATPLQKKLAQLGKVLGIVCLLICLVIFVLGIYRGYEMFDMFITAVALAVAAIPEGLSVVITVILAMGMQKMVKSNAIVKKLSAVETLGSTTVICSDKTGTLTQNKMTVVSLFDGKNKIDVGTQIDINTKANSISKLLEGASLCNDAVYNKATGAMLGDPTESALLVAADKYDIDNDELKSKYPRINEMPFDSGRKLMSTFHDIDNEICMYTKGAPDELLRRCAYYYNGGDAVELTDTLRDGILEQNNEYAINALRVLGVAYRSIENPGETDSDISEKDLIFIGLIGMIDPPREEAAAAVKTCKNAGIQVKMITGDHKTTASAIGREIGIEPYENAIEGRDISAMDDDQLREAVKTTSIFARVSPEHKVRIVKAIKANGNIVAMTGDGVNDAPSLKFADIGVAMGITGTDVSKEAADMILTDDNFASIVKAVEEGRTIYENIRKVVGYLLSCNIGEILLIFVAMLIGLPVPLAAIHLLFINLITDAFPAFAIGMEEKEDGIMDRMPRKHDEAIVDKKMLVSIAVQSAALCAGCLASFIIGYYYIGGLNDFELGTTMCFVTIIAGELLRAYSARSEQKSVFKMNLFGNSFLHKSVLASLVFLAAAVYVPFLQPVFKTQPLTAFEMSLALLLAVIPMLGGEAAKLITKNMH